MTGSDLAARFTTALGVHGGSKALTGHNEPALAKHLSKWMEQGHAAVAIAAGMDRFFREVRDGGWAGTTSQPWRRFVAVEGPALVKEVGRRHSMFGVPGGKRITDEEIERRYRVRRPLGHRV